MTEMPYTKCLIYSIDLPYFICIYIFLKPSLLHYLHKIQTFSLPYWLMTRFESLHSSWTDAMSRISFCINKQDTWQKNSALGDVWKRSPSGCVWNSAIQKKSIYNNRDLSRMDGMDDYLFVKERRRYEIECTWDNRPNMGFQGLSGNRYTMVWEVFKYWTWGSGSLSEPGCALWHDFNPFFFATWALAQDMWKVIRARRTWGLSAEHRVKGKVRWKQINQ